MKYFLDRPDYPRGKRYIPYYDITFILDSSASITEANFKLSITTAKNLVTRFDPDTQFAAITFGTNAVVQFKFNSSKVRIWSMISQLSLFYMYTVSYCAYFACLDSPNFAG